MKSYRQQEVEAPFPGPKRTLQSLKTPERSGSCSLQEPDSQLPLDLGCRPPPAWRPASKP